ncbi:MAG: hypothetical protein J2P53_12915, partial [Bradyrhizobiaceae bacterium]|nr:hypothetical protein [Bradyrhizobiaceae bacterium]
DPEAKTLPRELNSLVTIALPRRGDAQQSSRQPHVIDLAYVVVVAHNRAPSLVVAVYLTGLS